MANWVAITWENDRLLFLSATTTGRTATFEHAETLDDPKKLGEIISQYRLAKAETIVILNRSDVEVRPLVFPPVPTEELPDLVKFQAGKEFNNYDPNAPVDFFVTSKLENVSRSTLFPAVKPSEANAAPDGAPKHILASTLRLSTFQKIKTFCEEHHLVLRHIVLRPCTTAALWRQSGTADPNRVTLLVELDKHEASQTVIFQGEPMFMRSPKITRPQDVSVPDFAARILAELKRTRIAVRNEIQGIDVNEVVLCGNGAAFQSLAEQLTQGLEMPVRLFDPLQGLTVKAKGVSEHYAALLGAIRQIVRREPLHIDFCNPKKRVESASRRNIVTAIAAAVFLFVIFLFGSIFYHQMILKRDIKDLNQRLVTLKRTSGNVVEQKKQLDEIDKWRAGDVNWFEQLAWLSENALPAQNMMISGLDFTSVGSGGTIKCVALLQNESFVSQIEERFRDASHILQPGPSNPVTGAQRYTYRRPVSIHLSKPAESSGQTPSLQEDTSKTDTPES